MNLFNLLTVTTITAKERDALELSQSSTSVFEASLKAFGKQELSIAPVFELTLLERAACTLNLA